MTVPGSSSPNGRETTRPSRRVGGWGSCLEDRESRRRVPPTTLPTFPLTPVSRSDFSSRTGILSLHRCTERVSSP